MIQVPTVLPCSKALKGPNGYHIRAGCFVRYFNALAPVDLDFLVALHVQDEPPPDVQIEVYDPRADRSYRGAVRSELDPVSPIHHMVVRVPRVIIDETGEYAFRLILNGKPVLAGPLWGYNR